MSKPVLYNYDLDDHCYRLRLTAAICGTDYETTNLDIFPGHDHQATSYLTRNPLGRVPVLEHEGMILRETAAIQSYLASLGNEDLTPESAAGKAAMLDWMIFADRDLACASQARFVALLGAPGDGPTLTAEARTRFRAMDDHMTRQVLLGASFFAGENISLADLALFPIFALSRDFGIDHDEYPALRLWARRVRRTAGFITMPGIPDYH